MSSARALALAALFITTLSSPIIPSIGLFEFTPSCTIDRFTIAPIQTDCTFLSTTLLHTTHVNCHGCAVRTRRIGAGLPCKKATTIPGTTQKVVTSCLLSTRTSPYANYIAAKTASTPPTSTIPFTTTPQTTVLLTPCATWVPAPKSAFDGLCHEYPDTATVMDGYT